MDVIREIDLFLRQEIFSINLLSQLAGINLSSVYFSQLRILYVQVWDYKFFYPTRLPYLSFLVWQCLRQKQLETFG
jgi:hypothetical protein